ncbi:MAG: methionine biosynthesis protein MetW [Solirubrobacterales bacterium]|nr:methionine biosynthesis protein MetW [Solirubrobacterales bacterium]
MRPDLDIVAAMIGRDVRVLDLGCGNGALLEALIERQGCRGLGVENDLEDFHECIGRGVPVTHGDLEQELHRIDNDAFDWAVLSLTLQAVKHPDDVLSQMKRVAPRLIVSLPNFGHWRLRRDLTLRGHMPVTPTLPYEWYDTPNIHLCTLRDFERLVRDLDLKVERMIPVGADGRRTGRHTRLAPNLLAERAVYSLST